VADRPPGNGSGLRDFLELLRDLARVSFIPALIVAVAFVAAFGAAIAAGVAVVLVGLKVSPPAVDSDEGAVTGMVGAVVAIAAFFSTFVVVCILGWLLARRGRRSGEPEQ
jgi:hypothetical protein